MKHRGVTMAALLEVLTPEQRERVEQFRARLLNYQADSKRSDVHLTTRSFRKALKGRIQATDGRLEPTNGR